MAGNTSRYLGPVKLSKNGRALGRPRQQPSENAAARIEELASKGVRKQGLAQAFGVAVPVLNRWLDEDPKLHEAMLRGRESERQVLHGRVYDFAVNGEGRDALIASLFLLKSCHKYRDSGEEPDAANRVTVNISLPGAMKPLEFAQEVKDVS